MIKQIRLDDETNNCIIAGCPAKIVKKDINWDRKRPKQYIQDLERNINDKIS
jgi:hypothetical protein